MLESWRPNRDHILRTPADKPDANKEQAPQDPQQQAPSEYTPVPIQEEMGTDEKDRPVRYIIDSEGKRKRLNHAPGVTDDEMMNGGPAEEDEDTVRENSPWVASRQRKITQAIENFPRGKRELGKVFQADTREGRIAREVIRFNELARAGQDNSLDIYKQIRDALPEPDRDLFREQVRKTGWNINGDVRQGGAEEPEPETPQYSELLPFKTRRDMEREFGQPAGKVNGIPFWVLEDGDAALVAPSSEHAQRIGQNGYLKLKGDWYEFKEGNFSAITEQEARTRSAAIQFRAMTAEERRRLREGAQPAQTVDPYAQQLSEDEGQPPPVESPAEAERYGNIDPVLGEGQAERGVSDAQKDFERLFTAPDKLAEAYHEAIQRLSAADREEFNENLYAGYPELRASLGAVGGSELAKVINNELRTNPPPKEETIVRNPEAGVSKAYSMFKKKYSPEDRGSLAHAYRDAVRGLTPAERDEFDDGLERIIDVPPDILASMINEERKNNPPKEKREQQQRGQRDRGQRQQQQRPGGFRRRNPR